MKSFQDFINLSEKTIASAGRVSDAPDPQQQDIEDFKRETSRHRPRPSKGQRQVTSYTYRTPESGVSWEVSKGWDKKVPSTPEEILQRVELSAEKKKKAQQIRQNVFQKPERVKKISTGNNPPTPEVIKPPVELPKSTRTSAQRVTPGISRIPTSRQLPAPALTPVATPASTVVSAPKPTEIKLPKPQPIKKSAVTPKVTTPAAPSLSAEIQKGITGAKEAEKAAASAASSAKALKVAKAYRTIGRIATPVAAGLDAYGGYQAAREAGASKKRSIGAGIARAAGGVIGGGIGGAVGSVLGPVGSIAGTVSGYGAGADLGTKVYNKLTGPVGKDFKVSDLGKNIKSGIASGKKSFKSFVAQADKSLSRYA